MAEPLPPDFWKPFGEQRWKELGDSVGCSMQQVKFACARFNGATQTGAAKLAGYQGDENSIRGAGYSAARTTGVQNLIELASIEAPADAKIADKEIDAKLAKMIRSPDSQVSLKAMELHAKREQAKADAEATRAENGDVDPIATLKDLAQVDPELAQMIAARHGVTIPGFDLRKWLEQPRYAPLN